MARLSILLLCATALVVSAKSGLRSGAGNPHDALVPSGGNAPAHAPAPANGSPPPAGAPEMVGLAPQMHCRCDFSLSRHSHRRCLSQTHAQIKQHLEALGPNAIAPLSDLGSRAVCDTFAVNGPNLGGVVKKSCVMGKTTEAVTLYRAYSESPEKAQPIGAYWGLHDIRATHGPNKAAYKEEMGVCNDWNDANMIISCEFPAGLILSAGQTESAKCNEQVTLPRTNSVQVFLDTFGQLKALRDTINGEPRPATGPIEAQAAFGTVKCTRTKWE